MNDSAPTATFSEAARLMGWRSRSQLYRLRDSGALRDYLREGAKGAMVLALEPPGLPTLEEHLREVVRTQINSPGRPRKQPPDPMMAADRQLAQLQHQLAKMESREKAWIRDYATFRKWVSEQSWLDLHRQFPDVDRIGEVMVYLRETMLAKLKPLDSCELDSRFPR